MNCNYEEGIEELDPNDPASAANVKDDLDVDKIVQLIESVRQKQGNTPKDGTAEEREERSKLLKAAQNLHIWMNTNDPVRILVALAT